MLIVRALSLDFRRLVKSRILMSTLFLVKLTIFDFSIQFFIQNQDNESPQHTSWCISKCETIDIQCPRYQTP